MPAKRISRKKSSRRKSRKWRGESSKKNVGDRKLVSAKIHEERLCEGPFCNVSLIFSNDFVLNLQFWKGKWVITPGYEATLEDMKSVENIQIETEPTVRPMWNTYVVKDFLQNFLDSFYSNFKYETGFLCKVKRNILKIDRDPLEIHVEMKFPWDYEMEWRFFMIDELRDTWSLHDRRGVLENGKNIVMDMVSQIQVAKLEVHTGTGIARIKDEGDSPNILEISRCYIAQARTPDKRKRSE